MSTINPPVVFDSLQYGFSQGVIVPAGKRILLSGQVGIGADERLLSTTLAGQTDAAFANIARLLEHVGGSLANVVFLRIYIKASEQHEQDRISAALKAHFPLNPPASSWILVSGLSLPEWLIEIEAEAIVA